MLQHTLTLGPPNCGDQSAMVLPLCKAVTAASARKHKQTSQPESRQVLSCEDRPHGVIIHTCKPVSLKLLRIDVTVADKLCSISGTTDYDEHGVCVAYFIRTAHILAQTDHSPVPVISQLVHNSHASDD